MSDRKVTVFFGIHGGAEWTGACSDPMTGRLYVSANEVPWVIAYGISDNTRAFWSLASARTQLGYRPQDDSEVAYASDVRRLLVNGAAGAAGPLGNDS